MFKNSLILVVILLGLNSAASADVVQVADAPASSSQQSSVVAAPEASSAEKVTLPSDEDKIGESEDDGGMLGDADGEADMETED